MGREATSVESHKIERQGLQEDISSSMQWSVKLEYIHDGQKGQQSESLTKMYCYSDNCGTSGDSELTGDIKYINL